MRRNRTDEAVNLSFMDLLTGALGGVALILFGFMHIYKNISKENFKPVLIQTQTLPAMHEDEEIDFTFSAIGGLEPYKWTLVNIDEGIPACPRQATLGLPKEITLDPKSGQLQGKLSPDGQLTSPHHYCFSVRVEATGSNADKTEALDAYRQRLKKSDDFSSPEQIEREVAKINHKISTSTRDFSLAVWPPLYEKPQIVTGRLAVAPRLGDYWFPLSATKGLEPYSWSIEGLPRGLSIDSESGVISGTPDIKFGKDRRKYELTARVTDSTGENDEQTFILSIGDRLKTIEQLEISTTQEDFDSHEFLLYKRIDLFKIRAAGGILGERRWSMKFSPSGFGLKRRRDSITGTPTQLGTLRVSILVEDGKDSDEKEFTIDIKPQKLAFETSSRLPDGVKGIDYKANIIATGGVRPYKWQATLPGSSGLETEQIGDNFRITGIPPRSEIVNIPVTVLDSQDSTATRVFEIDFNEPLKIATDHLRDGIVDQGYDESITAEGGLTPYKWSITSTPPAPWLKDDKENPSRIFGRPLESREYTITGEVTDGTATTVKKDLTLIVKKFSDPVTNNPPSIVASVGTGIPQGREFWNRIGFSGLSSGCHDPESTCVLGPAFAGIQFRNPVIELGVKDLRPGKKPLPDWLDLQQRNEGGWILKGTPMKTGEFLFSLEFGWQEQTLTQNFKIKILSPVNIYQQWREGNPGPFEGCPDILSNCSIGEALIDSHFSHLLSRDLDLSTELVDGLLPPGVSILKNDDGELILFGRPLQAGQFHFSLSFAPGLPGAAAPSQNFSLEVRSKYEPPTSTHDYKWNNRLSLFIIFLCSAAVSIVIILLRSR